MNRQFHLSLPCEDLQETKEFYTNILEGKINRIADDFIDLDFYGTLVTFTDTSDFNFNYETYTIGKHIVPSFHFGVIVTYDEWENLYNKLNKLNVETTSEAVFFEKKVGEYISFFIVDPNGYSIEFKSFRNYGESFSV